MTLGQTTPGREFKTRYLYIGAAMLLGLGLLAINLYRLQVVHHEELLAKSQDNYIKEVRIRADRGMIKDKRGEILVDGRPSFDLFITPAFCQKCVAEVLPRLQPWLGWTDEDVGRVGKALREKHGTQRFQPLAVKVDLTRDELDVVSAHLLQLPGVDVVPVQHRNYRAGSVLAHLLGYMNEVTQDELGGAGKYALGDYIGRRGIERAFELRTCGGQRCSLRGEDGLRLQQVNARGEPRREQGQLVQQDVKLPTPGNNIVLTLDARLQAEAERAFPGTAGAVIAVDVRNGFVLAMLSRPSYDPNELTGRISSQRMQQLIRDPLQPMVYRPTAQHYSPGSTFKAISLLTALQSKQFSTGTTVFCPGGYRLGARRWRCHKDSGHGPVNARKALQVSCDTYFYRVSDVLGIDPIAETGKAFGFGRPTGLVGIAEVPGIMPDTAYHDRVTPGGYQKGMALNTAIGQGDVNVTPLQLVMSYAALANGGTLYAPQLVKRIEAPDGHVLEDFQPKVVHQTPIDAEHQRVITDALVAVVNEAGGTAYRSRLKEVKVAGKTGTAQVVRLGAIRQKKEQMEYFSRDHAWFVAWAPAEAPEIAIVVLNEHGGHGGSDAAPTAAAVLQKYFDLKKEDAAAAAGTALEQPGVAPASPAGSPAIATGPENPLASVGGVVAAPAPRLAPAIAADAGVVVGAIEPVVATPASPDPGAPASPPPESDEGGPTSPIRPVEGGARVIGQLRVEKRMLAHVPWGLVLGTVTLALIGIYNLASAARTQPGTLWMTQLLFLGAGLFSAAVIASIDYRVLQRLAIPIYLANVGLLIALKFFGHTAKGAESWFAIGPFRLQPAEFMKISMILMAARWFHDAHRPSMPSYGFIRLIIPTVLMMAPTVLVLSQPDLGTALMMTFTALTLILFARVKWWVAAALGIGMLAGGVVLWNDWIRQQNEPRQTLVRHYLKKHQDARIVGWLDPEADPRGTNYHALQSKIAVGSGGLTGKGWKQGTQTGNQFLPEMHTDFVFSVWAEEHGFLACLVLLVFYGFILISALGVAFNARDRFGATVAVGIAAMIFWQVFENVGMVTGLLPVTGITLPLLSYGGSSMVSVMLGIGLLVNIGMRRHIF